jgi:hypothetical protein
MNASENKDMSVWSLLGLSVAVVAIFAVVITEFCQHSTLYRVIRSSAYVTLIIAGIAFVIIGLSLQRRHRQLADANGSMEKYEKRFGPSSHLFFWGAVLVAFGVVVLCVPYEGKEQIRIVAARTTVQMPRTSAPPTVVMTPRVTDPSTNLPTFPDIKIRGLIYRPPKSAVIVEGRSYFVGDQIGNARIFSIEPRLVVLEINGNYKSIPVDRPSLQIGGAPSGVSLR